MTPLISKPDFIAATRLGKYGLAGTAGPLMRLTGLEAINTLYADHIDKYGLDFIDGLLESMQIDISVDEKELSRIPRSGPFITVSNHPFGLWDGMGLIREIARIRPEFRVMANFLLTHVLPVKDFFIGVNPFEGKTASYSSLSGMKEAMGHLRDGMPMGIFPAGEVSAYQLRNAKVTDRSWQPPALKLIQKANVPIIPIYFQGSNSNFFHLMGLIHPLLRTAALPSETLKKKNTRIKMRIGQPISLREQAPFADPESLGRYLRAKTYSLGSGLKKQTPSLSEPITPEGFEPLADPVPGHMITEEIEAIREKHFCFRRKNFEVFIADSHDIPLILNELGRLRELTFRKVGEGTGQACDLDLYDPYYKHLFIWDNKAKQIAGAYRLGQGDEILEKYGKKGLYIHSLFKIKEPFEAILGKSLELGRSFILEEYQKQRLPLFLLWQGITYFLQRHPQYQYLTGPVSISNAYSRLSRRFMVAFIRKYHFDRELEKHVKPRKKFRSRLGDAALHDLLEDIPNDLKMADQVIADLEPAHFKLPVLLKKYIRKNARIIGFNLDPKFNNALDGFMILDLKDLPEGTLEDFRPQGR